MRVCCAYLSYHLSLPSPAPTQPHPRRARPAYPPLHHTPHRTRVWHLTMNAGVDSNSSEFSKPVKPHDHRNLSCPFKAPYNLHSILTDTPGSNSAGSWYAWNLLVTEIHHYRNTPYLALLYFAVPNIPYPTLHYLTLHRCAEPYLDTPYPTLLYLTWPYRTVHYLTLPCLALPRPTVPYLHI